jgi:hypothetical protein
MAHHPAFRSLGGRDPHPQSSNLSILSQGLLKVAISIAVSLRNRRSHSLRSGHALPVEAISPPKLGIASAKIASQ